MGPEQFFRRESDDGTAKASSKRLQDFTLLSSSLSNPGSRLLLGSDLIFPRGSQGWGEVYYELPPGAPVNLKVEVKGGEVYLNWEEPVETGGGIDGYVIYRKEKGGEWKEIGRVNGTEFVDREVKEGKEYYYRVCGVNSGGEGEKAEVKVKIEGGGGINWLLIIVVIVVGIGAGIGAWIFLKKRKEEINS